MVAQASVRERTGNGSREGLGCRGFLNVTLSALSPGRAWHDQFYQHLNAVSGK